MKKKLLVWAVRFLSAVLFLFTMRLAWAGVWMYQGNQSFKEKNYEKALQALEKAKVWDPHSPQILELTGQSALEEGILKKNADFLQRAAEAFNVLSARPLPGYAKARVWNVLAESSLTGKVSEEKWGRLKKMLQEAVELEPGSAWAAYQSGVLFLKQDELLSEQEKKWALEQIRKAIGFHVPDESALYLPLPSPFLEPALEFLWEHSHDFEKLKAVTPADYASYKKLLEVMDRKGLWKYREGIHNLYLDLARQLYEAECERAERWFKEGKYREAWFAFRKAFWAQSWAYVRAKAGLLASEKKLGELKPGEHALLHKDYREVLEEIWKNQDEAIPQDILKWLEPLKTQKAEEDFKTESELPEIGEWWSRGNRLNLLLNLKPGHAKLVLTFKLPPASRTGAYLLLRLSERELKGVYVTPGSWKKIEVPVKSSGGARWLVAEVMNADKEKAGPGVIPGPVKLKYTFAEQGKR